MEKGILTAVQEKELAVMLDDLVKLKGLWELVDGYVFKVVITLLDDTVIDKIKEDIKVKLAALVDAVMAKDVTLAEQLATDIVNGLIDIPGLDEDAEGLIFGGIIQLVVGAILAKLQSIKGEQITLKLAKPQIIKGQPITPKSAKK
jgi:hypothetical protein